MAAAAVAAGMPGGTARHFATSDEAAAAITGLVRPGDLVLVKGSRFMKMEQVVAALVPAAASKEQGH